MSVYIVESFLLKKKNIVESFRAFLYNIGDLLKLGPANVTGLPIDTLGTVELAIGWVRSRFINV